jgi:hypothetical protein
MCQHKRLTAVATFLLLSVATTIDAFGLIQSPLANVVSSSYHLKRLPSFASTSFLTTRLGNSKSVDPLPGDQREGMADAFAAFDSLSQDDFKAEDSSIPSLEGLINSLEEIQGSISNEDDGPQLLTDSQDVEEMDEVGKELFSDMMADLPENGDLNEESTQEEIDELQKVLNDIVSISVPKSAAEVGDVDGIGVPEEPQLTAADVKKDILSQSANTAFSEELISSSITDDLLEIQREMKAGGLDISNILANEEMKRKIEEVYKTAFDKLVVEIEELRREDVSFLITTNFRSSENGFEVLSRVAFATKVFRRLFLPRCCRRKLEIRTRKTFKSGPNFKVFFSLDRKFVVYDTNVIFHSTHFFNFSRPKGCNSNGVQ